MRKFILLLFVAITQNGISQNSFQLGYFINENGVKVEGLLKDNDLMSTPQSLEYKLSDKEKVTKLGIDNLAEFAFLGGRKYKKFTVQIDKSSSNDYAELSQNRLPEFKKETLILELIIEGKINLYTFRNGDNEKFFYGIDNDIPKQFIFKKYKVGQLEVAKNETYKQQLKNILGCSLINDDSFKSATYTRVDFIRLFKKYYESEGGSYKFHHYNIERKKNRINIIVGFEMTNATTDFYGNRPTGYKFGSFLSYNLGLAYELYLPIRNNKMSVLVEPSFRFANMKDKQEQSTLELNYKSVFLPVGVRYYFKELGGCRFYSNAMLNINKPLKSNLIYNFQNPNNASNFNRYEYEIEDIDLSYSLGLGVDINENYALELRYNTSIDLLPKQGNYDLLYKPIELKFSYRINKN